MALLDAFWRRCARPHYQRGDIEKVVNASPPGDVIRDVYANAAVQDALTRYEIHDGKGVFFQTWNRRYGDLLNFLALAGLCVGLATIFDIGTVVPWLSEPRLIALQGGILFLLLFAGRILTLGKAEERWMEARTTAERSRGEIFSAVVLASAAGDGRSATLAKYALVDIAHGRNQLDYFAKKVSENKRRWRFLQPVVTTIYWLLILALGATAAWHFADAFQLTFIPGRALDVLAIVASFLNGKFHSVAMLAAASFAAMLQASDTRGLSASNATLYSRGKQELGEIVAGAEHGSLRTSAAGGDLSSLQTYLEHIQRVLRVVHEDWARDRRLNRNGDPPDLGPGN